MAQLEINANEARRLLDAMRVAIEDLQDYQRFPRQLEEDGTTAAKVQADIDQHQLLLERIRALSFNTRECPVCGTEFEAANPRKKTCSDKCRQQLSRLKRGTGQRHAPAVTSSPTVTVTPFQVGDTVRIVKGGGVGSVFTIGSLFWSDREGVHRCVPEGSTTGGGIHPDCLERHTPTVTSEAATAATSA